MKYRDEYGNWQEIYLEALDDGLPIGTLVNYNGDDADIPSNWEKIAEDISTGIKVLRKTSQTTPTNATIIDDYSESQTDAYSANYVNNIVDNFDDTTGDLDDLNTTDKSNLVNAINEVGYDYIVEQGTNDIWFYRKWASGLAECWGTKQYTGMNLNQSSAGTYYGDAQYIDYPINLFQNIELVSGGKGVGSTSSGVYLYSVGLVTVSGTQKVEVNFRAHTSSTNVNCPAFVHIYGKWK